MIHFFSNLYGVVLFYLPFEPQYAKSCLRVYADSGPRSACASAQSDQGLRCPLPECINGELMSGWDFGTRGMNQNLCTLRMLVDICLLYFFFIFKVSPFQIILKNRCLWLMCLFKSSNRGSSPLISIFDICELINEWSSGMFCFWWRIELIYISVTVFFPCLMELHRPILGFVVRLQLQIFIYLFIYFFLLYLLLFCILLNILFINNIYICVSLTSISIDAWYILRNP